MALVGPEPVKRACRGATVPDGSLLPAVAFQAKGLDALPRAGLASVDSLEELQPTGIVFGHLSEPPGLLAIAKLTIRTGLGHWSSRCRPFILSSEGQSRHAAGYRAGKGQRVVGTGSPGVGSVPLPVLGCLGSFCGMDS